MGGQRRPPTRSRQHGGGVSTLRDALVA